MDKKITFIGYGNPLRGDDGVAHIVLNILEEMLSLDTSAASGQVVFKRRHQLDVVDAELVSKSRVVVFVDAHIDPRKRDVEINEITGSEASSVNVTHISSPDELLSLAAAIYEATPTAFICAVRGYDFSYGERVSEQALRLARKAAEELFDLMETLR